MEQESVTKYIDYYEYIKNQIVTSCMKIRIQSLENLTGVNNMRMKVSIYGAGRFTRRYLAFLEKEYNIEYIFDLSSEKTGTMLGGIPITVPNEFTVNVCPVIIVIRDVLGGYHTLQKLSCRQDIYILVGGADSAYVFQYNPKWSVEEMFRRKKKITGDFYVKETSMDYVPGERRCFDMTWRSRSVTYAGSAACVHSLWYLNEKYHMIRNLFTLWSDVLYVPRNYIGGSGIPSVQPQIDENEFQLDGVFNSLAKHPILYAAKYIELAIIKDFWLLMDSIFNFKSSDLFLVQDNISAYALCTQFPKLKKIVAVYHSQGSLRCETAKSDPCSGETYDAIQENLLEQVKMWAFPSKGAANALMETGTSKMRQLAQTCKFYFIHSGYLPKVDLSPDQTLVSKISHLEKVEVTFVSASMLYHNKGVERIPAILSKLKHQTGLRIRWILIGSGETEQEVQENIERYLLPDDYIWYRSRFKNIDDLFYIFTKSDFYIMMHRVSIFDLSILQSMAYGCIPFLSNVGGNLEFCAYDNGILIDVDDEVLDLNKITVDGSISLDRINDLKELNKKVIEREFSYKNFITKYKNVVESV